MTRSPVRLGRTALAAPSAAQVLGPSADAVELLRAESTDFGHFPPARAAGLTGEMFVSEEQTLTVSFAVAASRLTRLAGAGWLREVSETVYQGGVEYLIRVGPGPPRLQHACGHQQGCRPGQHRRADLEPDHRGARPRQRGQRSRCHHQPGSRLTAVASRRAGDGYAQFAQACRNSASGIGRCVRPQIPGLSPGGLGPHLTSSGFPLRAFLRFPVCPLGSSPSSAFFWFPFVRRSPVPSLRPSLSGSGSPSVSLRVPFPLSNVHVSAAAGQFRGRWSRAAGTKVTSSAAIAGLGSRDLPAVQMGSAADRRSRAADTGSQAVPGAGLV
jgi:hypothetical protein